jgi:hypothetical protein
METMPEFPLHFLINLFFTLPMSSLAFNSILLHCWFEWLVHVAALARLVLASTILGADPKLEMPQLPLKRPFKSE